MLRLIDAFRTDAAGIRHDQMQQYPPAAPSLTALLVQNDLSLILPAFVQRNLHLRRETLAGLTAVQEVAHAALLHQLAAGEAGQFAEAI